MRRNAIATTPVAVTQYLDAVNVRKVIRAVTCYIEAFLNVKVVILHMCFQHTYTVYQIFYGGSYWILVSKKYELLSTMELYTCRSCTEDGGPQPIDVPLLQI